MKNVNRFKTHEEAENAFLAECCAEHHKSWYAWSDEMKNRYRLWLFEDFVPRSELNWVRDPSCSSTNEDPPTKTYSNTKTIYWTNPPCFDDNNTNNSIEDYNKAAKEAVDAWFSNLKEQTDGGKTRLNKDRFDDFDSAWNCFEYECDWAGNIETGSLIFTMWLFYPYIPGAVRTVRESAVVKNLRDRFSKMGYSESLEDENKRLRQFITEMFKEFPIFSFVAENPVRYETRKNGSE